MTFQWEPKRFLQREMHHIRQTCGIMRSLTEIQPITQTVILTVSEGQIALGAGG
jgi:transposase